MITLFASEIGAEEGAPHVHSVSVNASASAPPVFEGAGHDTSPSAPPDLKGQSMMQALLPAPVPPFAISTPWTPPLSVASALSAVFDLLVTFMESVYLAIVTCLAAASVAAAEKCAAHAHMQQARWCGVQCCLWCSAELCSAEVLCVVCAGLCPWWKC